MKNRFRKVCVGISGVCELNFFFLHTSRCLVNCYRRTTNGKINKCHRICFDIVLFFWHSMFSIYVHNSTVSTYFFSAILASKMNVCFFLHNTGMTKIVMKTLRTCLGIKKNDEKWKMRKNIPTKQKLIENLKHVLFLQSRCYVGSLVILS